MRPLPPYGRPAGRRRPRGTAAMLLLSVGWAVLAAVLPGSAGLVALALAVATLAGASVLSLRAQWIAILTEDAGPGPAAGGDPAAELTDRLRRLREDHVARVDAALDQGRPDVAQRLTDAYTDAALRAITDAALHPSAAGRTATSGG